MLNSYKDDARLVFSYISYINFCHNKHCYTNQSILVGIMCTFV